MQYIFNLLGIHGFELGTNVEGFLSLTLFTVLVQCGAGMAILKALCPRSGRSGGLGAVNFQLWAFIAGIFVAIGTGVSLLHLNDPMRAPFALNNPLESWLSMEIYAVSALGVTLLFCLFGSKYIFRLLSGVAGGFAVFSMAQVYIETSSATWATVNTYVTFFSTTLLLGAVGLLCASLLSRKDKIAVLTGVLPKLILLFLVVRMVSVALLVLRSQEMGVQANVPLMDSHITLTGIGAGLLLTCLMQSAMKSMIRVMHGEKQLMARTGVKPTKKKINKKIAKADKKHDANITKNEKEPELTEQVSNKQNREMTLEEALADDSHSAKTEKAHSDHNLVAETQTTKVQVEIQDSIQTEPQANVQNSETQSDKVGHNTAEIVSKENSLEDYSHDNETSDAEIQSDKTAHNKYANRHKHACTHYIKMGKISFGGFVILTLVLLGELAGRFMFYLLYANTGL